MPKKNKGKHKRNSTQPPTNKSPFINSTSGDEPPKKKKWWQTGGAVFAFVVAILTLITLLTPVKEFFMSKRAIYEEKNFDSGTIKPLSIRNIDLDYDTLELKDRPIFNKARRDNFPPVKGVKVKEDGGNMIVIIVGTGQWV